MMLYIDKNVEKLAEVANCPSDVVSRKVVEYIEDNGLIDCPECYCGCSLLDTFAEQDKTPIVKVCGVFPAIGIDKPTYREFETLMKCVLFGDGDCPECGGECEVIDGEYRTHQQDRDSEPETETIWEEKQCLSCGNRFYN